MWVLEQEPALQEDPDFKDTYRGWMDANPRKFFVAQQDGALIGMLNLMIFERMPKPGKVQCWSLRRAPDAAHSPGATVVV